LYKCKNADGRIYYSDTGCPATSEVLKKKKKSSENEPIDPFEDPKAKGAPKHTATPPIEDNKIPLAAAKFSQALISLAPVRVAVSQFYAQQGEWPRKMGDIGFNASEMNSTCLTGQSTSRMMNGLSLQISAFPQGAINRDPGSRHCCKSGTLLSLLASLPVVRYSKIHLVIILHA